MGLGLVLQKGAVALEHLDRCARHATRRILAAAHDVEALVQHLLRDRGRARDRVSPGEHTPLRG